MLRVARFKLAATTARRFYSQNKPLTFVVLEGEPIMSHKAKVLNRLDKMGYTTHHFDHFLHQWIADNLPPPYDALHKYADDVEATIKNNLTKDNHKGNHVFIDGSPLTPILYLSPHSQHVRMLKDRMKQLSQQYKIRSFVCESDFYEAQFRLGCDKYELVERDEKMIEEEYIGRFRSHFDGEIVLSKEDEIVNFVHHKYRELQNEGWFEQLIHTSDTQQACCKLLEILDLRFKLPDMPKWT